jgi:pimeloyl-ACP methyl ester carboxylesterase
MMVDLPDCQLSCEVRGDGEPLLLVHGFMGIGANWQYVFPADPEGYRVIQPDLRGHGRSTNPSGAFTFRQAALDLLGLLDALGIDRVKAIGLSGGGLALLHLATLQPDRVRSMVLVSAPPYFPAQAKAIQARFSQDMLPDAERAAMRVWHVGGEEQIRALIGHTRGFSVNDEDVGFTSARLATITADTLIVFGDRERFGLEPMYPVSLAFELHAAIRRSFLWVVPNGGHGPIFGPHAQAFVATAMSFLRGDWTATSENA